MRASRAHFAQDGKLRSSVAVLEPALAPERSHEQVPPNRLFKIKFAHLDRTSAPQMGFFKDVLVTDSKKWILSAVDFKSHFQALRKAVPGLNRDFFKPKNVC